MSSRPLTSGPRKSNWKIALAASTACAVLGARARAGVVQFKDADGSLRTWNTADNTTPIGGQYSPPQSNSYTTSVDQTSGTMTGRFGIDSAMVTPVSISVGSMISYDYKLTNEQRNFRGTGASNWVGDSYGDFRGGDPFDYIGYLISGRAGYQYDYYSDRQVRFQTAGFVTDPAAYSGATEDTSGIHIRWTFTTSSDYQISVTNNGDATPLAFFRGSTGGNATTDITFFRQGLNDSEQDVTLSKFYQYDTSTAPTGNTFTWSTGSGSYSTSGNWSPSGTPALGDVAVINNGGTVTINSSGPNAAKAYDVRVGSGGGSGTLNIGIGAELLVGNTLAVGNASSSGTLNQSGGLVRLMDEASDDLRIAIGAGSTGKYNLSGGELMVGDSLTVGRDGTGTLAMTGGMISQAGFITVGGNAGSNGTFNMSGGIVYQTFGDLEIGNFGVGTVDFSGGVFNVASGRALAVGNRIGGVGTATISGTALVTTEDLYIAGNDNTVTNLGGTGTLNINGGEVQINDDFIIGNYGNGTLNMTGGLVSESGWIVVGNNPGSSGTFNLSGGTINQSFGDLEVGDESTGVVNFSGGTFNGSWGFFVGNRRSGNGTATISGSALVKVQTVTVGGQNAEGSGAYGTGTLNVNGGELQINDDFIVGHLGTGTVTMTGGLISKSGWIVLGDEVGSQGTFNISAGTVSQTFGDLEIGDAGSGTFNQSGGTMNIVGTVLVGKSAGGVGNATVSGGALNASSLSIGVSGTGQMTRSGTGQVNVGDTHIGNSGRLTLAANGSASGTWYTNTLSIDANGVMDLNDNDLVVNNGVFTQVRALVFQGYSSSPDPSKTGIISTSGQSAGNTILALIDNALVGVSAWPVGSGHTVSANAILGKYTYFGDMDLDGQVTAGDYGILDANLGSTPDPGIAWISGDADLDGQVTSGDYGILDANLGAGVGSPLTPSAVGASAVPEPAAFGLLALAGAGFLRRVRGRK